MLKLALRYGSWMFVGFTVLFLLMHVIGLSDVIELRLLNGVIHLAVLWVALKYWVLEDQQRADNYPGGTALGVMISMVGAVGFGIFLAVFLGLNPNLLEQIRAQSPPALQPYINPVMNGVFITVEGTVVGLIGSYIIMRILEKVYVRSV